MIIGIRFTLPPRPFSLRQALGIITCRPFSCVWNTTRGYLGFVVVPSSHLCEVFLHLSGGIRCLVVGDFRHDRFLFWRSLTLLMCFWNAFLSVKSSSPPAPSWCGISSCAASLMVSLSCFPSALSPTPLINTCLWRSSKGILPHHRWVSFPWAEVGGVVVGSSGQLSSSG